MAKGAEDLLHISNATLLTPHRQLDGHAVAVDGDRIAAVEPAERLAAPAGARVIDAAGMWLAPGFVDLQLNGGFGHDFTAHPEKIWSVAAELPRYSVTSFLPTIVSSPPEKIAAARRVLAAGPPAGWRGAVPLGLHVEGPFLNPAKKGAHGADHLREPALAAAADWSPAQGVRLVTLAPELPGALPVVRALAERGVVVAAGHSMATLAEARAAFEAGVRYGTHLFNAMPALGHREPALTGALLSHPDLTVGLIADGLHVHPAMIDLAWRAKGGGRVTLVTDATAALGMPPGDYQLGGQTVTVGEGGCRLADGTLAGSVLSLDAALRNLMAFTGATLAEALPAVTSTPARLVGETGRGRIAPGCVADLVLLTAELEVAIAVAAGEVVYESI